MTRLYIVRHAQSQGNQMAFFQGHVDADVSENGLLQLEKLKERFKTIDFDIVYTSPLIRAYKTAEAANFYHQKPIIKHNGLIEIDGGCFEGKTWDEIHERFPEEIDAWENRPWSFAPEGGEPMRHVYDRIWTTMLSIAKENPGRSVVVVTHACAIRNFICRAKGLGLEHLPKIEWYRNTSISTVDFDENLSARIVSLNDASHLDSEAVAV